jgi:hypothetical protein
VTATIYRAIPSGTGERIRVAIAMRHGEQPPLGLPRGWATSLAADLGVTPAWVRAIAWRMRHGEVPTRGAIVCRVDSLPERLQRLERERPGLSRRDQAEALGTTYRTILDTAYRLRAMGGHAPMRIHRARPSTRVIAPQTGWRP